MVGPTSYPDEPPHPLNHLSHQTKLDFIKTQVQIHMERKRGAEKQITKDDAPDDGEDEPEPGNWVKADEVRPPWACSCSSARPTFCAFRAAGCACREEDSEVQEARSRSRSEYGQSIRLRRPHDRSCGQSIRLRRPHGRGCGQSICLRLPYRWRSCRQGLCRTRQRCRASPCCATR